MEMRWNQVRDRFKTDVPDRVRGIPYPACQSQSPGKDLEIVEEFNGISELSSREAIRDRGQARAPRRTTNSRVSEIRARKAEDQWPQWKA